MVRYTQRAGFEPMPEEAENEILGPDVGEPFRDQVRRLGSLVVNDGEPCLGYFGGAGLHVYALKRGGFLAIVGGIPPRLDEDDYEADHFVYAPTEADALALRVALAPLVTLQALAPLYELKVTLERMFLHAHAHTPDTKCEECETSAEWLRRTKGGRAA